MAVTGSLPPFSAVLKSRDVEDPVNLWVHRPLAYAMAAVLFRTPATPNQVTVAAMTAGIAAGVLWFIGGSTLVSIGGALLWFSSILDGVDGILARAKQMQSDLGRALDGAADMIVAVITVIAAFFHLWAAYQTPYHLPMMAVAVVTAVFQINLYDFYKESYMNSLNPDWDGRTKALEEAQDKLQKANEEGAPWYVRFALRNLADMLTVQARLRTATNPLGRRDHLRFPITPEHARIYRRHNYGPMQVWAMISLCPHTYIMSICAIVGRLDLYLWFRVVVGNALFILAILWQRRATARTLAELEKAGIGPVPDPTPKP